MNKLKCSRIELKMSNGHKQQQQHVHTFAMLLACAAGFPLMAVEVPQLRAADAEDARRRRRRPKTPKTPKTPEDAEDARRGRRRPKTPEDAEDARRRRRRPKTPKTPEDAWRRRRRPSSLRQGLYDGLGQPLHQRWGVAAQVIWLHLFGLGMAAMVALKPLPMMQGKVRRESGALLDHLAQPALV